MSSRDRLLAAFVAVCWGVNFPAIHVSLAQFPPFLLVAFRFTLLAVPTLLFVPRPAVPWRWILGYGLGFGVLQFVFLYLAMATGMPAGLASLVLQSSAPFTVLLAGTLLHEHVSRGRLAGVALAAGGLAGIAAYRAATAGGAALLPVALTLLGGLGWAIGNLCNRQARTTEPIRLMLWMTVVPPLPMAALSLTVEGPERIRTAFATVGQPRGILALGGLAFTVLLATVAGSGIWTALLSRYPSSAVAPFSMLVPVMGMGSSWLLLHETPALAELGWSALVVFGVVLAARVPAPAARSTRPVRNPAPGITAPHGVAVIPGTATGGLPESFGVPARAGALDGDDQACAAS